MGIIKKNESMPERPVIITLYGQPGCGKTSAAVTAANPLLIDTDRGADRAVSRCDTIFAQRWQDIDAERGAMGGYATVIIDTAKAMLDDYLSQWAIENNYKLKGNTLKRYGQMADDFKEFVSFLRSNGSDIIFICHDKETMDGDVIRHSPDCTGQSKDLLLRISDQVGYISKVNGKRTIMFEPMDNYVGKNVARLPLVEIPDVSSRGYKTFMSGIIGRVKEAKSGASNVNERVNGMAQDLRDKVDAIVDASEVAEGDTAWLRKINDIIEGMRSLPSGMQVGFFKEMTASLAKKGYAYDKRNKMFKITEGAL